MQQASFSLKQQYALYEATIGNLQAILHAYQMKSEPLGQNLNNTFIFSS